MQTFFLDIDPSTPDVTGFPTGLSWSLSDFRLKSVLVQPTDEWSHDHEGTLGVGLSLTELRVRGETILDVIKELNNDLEGKTVYIDDTRETELWLDKLYDAYSMEPSFELAPLTDLFAPLAAPEIEAHMNRIIRDNDLSPYESESRVFVLLHLAREEGII